MFLGNHFGHAISSSSNIVGYMLRHQHLRCLETRVYIFDATILSGNMKHSDTNMNFSLYYQKIESLTINNIFQKQF